MQRFWLLPLVLLVLIFAYVIYFVATAKVDKRENLPGTPIGIEWERNFDVRVSVDSELSVQQTSDGGFIIGTTIDISKPAQEKLLRSDVLIPGKRERPESPQDRMYLLKTDAAGRTLWARIHRKSSEGQVSTVLEASDGGFLMAGKNIVPLERQENALKAGSNKHNYYSAYLAKINRSGYPLWGQYYYADDCSSICSIAQGSGEDLVIFGRAYTEKTSGPFFMTIDKMGDKKGSCFIPMNKRLMLMSAQRTRDKGYIVAGWDMTGVEDRVFMLRVDQKGKQLWLHTFEASHEHYYLSQPTGNSHIDILANAPLCVRQVRDGGFVLTACIGGDYKTPGDMLLLKVDPQGKKEWAKTYGGTGQDRGITFLETRDNGYLVLGTTQSPDVQSAYLVRTDAEGRELWSTRLGGRWLGFYPTICRTQDGGCAIVGSNDEGIWLLKLSSEKTMKSDIKRKSE